MTLLGRVANAVRAVRGMFARVTSAAAPASVGGFFRFGRTYAGVEVDGDSMFKNAVVWACVNYLTRSIGQLPWRVLRELETGGAERASSHPVDWLLHKRPNPEMGAMTFRQTILARAVTRGNGYAEIQRDQRGMPVALWPIAPDRVRPSRRSTGELYYRVSQGGGTFVEIDHMNMFHLRGFPGDDGVLGLDVVSYAAQSIGWAQATEIFGSTFFGEGMNPAGVITGVAGADEETRNRTKAEFENLFKGAGKSHRTAYLDANQKWERISVRPDEAQFIETRQHQVDEICRWFGVPPHKVMHLLRATFSNIEHQSIEVVVDSLAPWAKLFEEEADYKLFGPANRQGLYTKIYLQALMRGDAKSRAEFYKMMRETGAMNVDEIRELEDMNPIGKAKGGEKYIVQAQYTTLEQVGEIADPPAVTNDPPAAGEPSDGTADTQAGTGVAAPPAGRRQVVNLR